MKLLDESRPPLDGKHFQVVVIGGGINGVAIARECARAGRRVLLLEQHDFGSGTTSRSTRIIHGGLRYLEHGELGLVRESLRERQRLLAERPHLVRPMQFLLALPPNGTRSRLAVRAGLWLYRTFGSSGRLRPLHDSQALERLLDSDRDWALFDYDDAQCEFPERLVAEWLCEAIAAGAIARNYTSALQIGRSGGQVREVRARDLRNGAEWRVQADWVVNASGPWVDAVLGSSRISTGERLIGGVRGSHTVLPKFPGAPDSAVYTEAGDRRPIFLVPWNGQVLVGTTEVADHSDPGATTPAPSEIEYLFRTFKKMFPHAPVTAADIRYAYAGVRPLPYTTGKLPAEVTRRHELRHHADDGAAGLISVIGGKLTTAASLAREVARAVGIRASEPALPNIAPAPADGIESSLGQWARQVSAIAGINEASARAISEWHGRSAMAVARLAGSDSRFRERLCDHCDHVVAEAVEAVMFESAVTLGDILLRRVPVGLSGECGTECARTAAGRIGTALGWSHHRIVEEMDAYCEERSRFLRQPDLSALDLGETAQRAA